MKKKYVTLCRGSLLRNCTKEDLEVGLRYLKIFRGDRPIQHHYQYADIVDEIEWRKHMSKKIRLWKGELLGDKNDDELRATITWILLNRNKDSEQAHQVYAEAKRRKLYDNQLLTPDDPLVVADDAVKKALGLKITIRAEVIE